MSGSGASCFQCLYNFLLFSSELIINWQIAHISCHANWKNKKYNQLIKFLKVSGRTARKQFLIPTQRDRNLGKEKEKWIYGDALFLLRGFWRALLWPEETLFMSFTISLAATTSYWDSSFLKQYASSDSWRSTAAFSWLIAIWENTFYNIWALN